MKKAAIIFNGIYFSYSVVEEAIAWAKINEGTLLGVFLSSKKETGEGYIYPSDLDSIENQVTDAEAELEDNAIIKNNSQMLQHLAEADLITIDIIILQDPSKKKLNNILSGCTQMFVHENIEDAGIVTVESIELHTFLTSLEIPIKIVHR